VFALKRLLSFLFNPDTYIWVDVLLIKETPKAILIEFDGRKGWLPKAWILAVKRNKDNLSYRGQPSSSLRARLWRGEAIFIKISEYNWAKKLW